MKRLVESCAVGVLFALVACGGDGDGGGGTSGVAGSKKLQELEAADIKKICEWERESYKDSLGSEEQYCLSFAVGPDEESCQEDLDECIASSDYEDELADDWECDDSTTEGLEDCEATVAQYEACVRAIDKAEAELLSGLSCGDEEPEYELPAECDDVIEICPAILDGTID